MRSPALISTRSRAGCHAVLASLSGRYPPLEGRSPTCYSPVCHSTDPLRDFRVRLACVRHAASVDSEPGSNSHVKCAVSVSSRGSRRDPNQRATGLTRVPIVWLLRCSIRCYVCGSPPGSSFIRLTPNTDCLILPTDSAAPLADTLSDFAPLTFADGATSRRVVCACTHYPVFKEPTLGAPWAPRVPCFVTTVFRRPLSNCAFRH